MIGSLSRETPVIVQGITGRMGRTHAALMRAYGTNIVGGTSTRTDMKEAAGVPVFRQLAAMRCWRPARWRPWRWRHRWKPSPRSRKHWPPASS